MCFSASDSSKVKRKCTIIAVLSLIIHIILSCLSIVVLTNQIHKALSDAPHILVSRNIQKPYVYFGNMDETTFHAFFGSSLALGVLGTFASIMLLIGIKYNKPGFAVVYLCYSTQASILMFIGGILLCLKLRWSFAIVMFKLSAIVCGMSIVVNRTYEVMVQHALLQQQNNISDLTLLIEEDLSDEDTASVHNK